MLDKVLESLYSKVFINIVVYNFKTVVYVEVLNQKGIIAETIKESFECVEPNTQMYEFISAYIVKTPFYYISVLDS